MTLCHICTVRRDMGDTTDEPKPATHICEELGREICADHAKYCAEDGHAATLIPAEVPANA